MRTKVMRVEFGQKKKKADEEGENR
jgi:hypothetical protein